MKAKELYEKHNCKNAATDIEKGDAAWAVLTEIVLEFKDLVAKRGMKDSVITAILNELEGKWKAFMKLVPEWYLNEDAFERLVDGMAPGGVMLWKGRPCAKDKF